MMMLANGCLQSCVHAAQGCLAAVLRRPLQSLLQARDFGLAGPMKQGLRPEQETRVSCLELGASSGECSGRRGPGAGSAPPLRPAADVIPALLPPSCARQVKNLEKVCTDLVRGAKEKQLKVGAALCMQPSQGNSVAHMG